MAEAAIEHSSARFFCHQCVQEVSPVLPDYVCSHCRSGFIEELVPPSPRASSSEGNDDVYLMASSLGALYDAHPAMPGTSSDPRWQRVPGQGRGIAIEGLMRRPQGSDPRQNPRAEGFLQQFIQSLHENTGFFAANTNFPVFVNLHGNPGDYVWGRGGWNAIITQLINQLDGSGPPPLSQDKIREIPTVKIAQEQVAKNLQCTVCMEDFQLDEPVRLLPCQHNFHDNCIIPWLELHGTCPICRKLLSNETTPGTLSNQEGASVSHSSTSSYNSSSRDRNNPSSPSDYSEYWD